MYVFGKSRKFKAKMFDMFNQVKLMQSELKLVKEFRRKRAQMQKELDEVLQRNILFT